MINERRIRNKLKEFSFPRLSGTQNEYKMFELIKTELESLNLSCNVQSFSFTKFYPKIYQKVTFSLTIWFLLVFFFAYNLLFILINLIIILSIFIPMFIITRNPSEIRIGKKYNSNNVYLNISDNSSKNSLKETIGENNLFLIAHIDSKGQTLPMLLRVINIRLWIYSLIASVILIVLKNFLFFNSIFFNIVTLIPLIVNLITTVIVLLNFSRNNSPGAIDDGTGLATLIELLHYFSSEDFSIKNYNLWFLFTGSEENGTMGIRNFFKLMNGFSKEKTKFLNIDSIAQKIDVWGPVNNSERDKGFYRSFMDLTRGDDLTFHFKPFIFATIRSDAYYLKTKGYRGFSIGDVTIYKYIHSKKDTIDKVDTRVLVKLCKIIISFLKKIDN